MHIHNNAFNIGNDIQIVWPILIDGQEIDLAGKPLTVTIVAPTGRRRDLEYTTQGNILTTEFLGMHQKSSGWYNLEIVYNKGKRGMKAVYAPNAMLLCRPYDGTLPSNSLNHEVLHMPTAYLQVGISTGIGGADLGQIGEDIEDLRERVERQEELNATQQSQIDANTELNKAQEEGLGSDAVRRLVDSVFGSEE